MKKFWLILFALVAMIAYSVQAEEEKSFNTNIEFSEFCPYKKMQQLDTSKHYLLSSKQYWSERKKKFEESKAFCNGMDSDEKKEICIDRLRNFEKDLTEKYFEQETQQCKDSFSPVLMLPFIR